MVPKALWALIVLWAPGPQRGQGCCWLDGFCLLASRAPAPHPLPCQHDCACHEPRGRGRHAYPSTWHSAALAGQTHTVCGPRIPGLLRSRPGPQPGKHQPALASPFRASFHLGKSQFPQPLLLAALVTCGPLFCSLLAAPLACVWQTLPGKQSS